MESHSDPGRPDQDDSPWYLLHAEELRRFLLGLLKHQETTEDVLQAVFLKAIEKGANVEESGRKGWLFTVAYHEAISARRRQTVRQRSIFKALAEQSTRSVESDQLLLDERIQQVRIALEALPPAQREVVMARVHEDKTFAEIARERNLPLGTVLTRMRRALAALGRILGDSP